MTLDSLECSFNELSRRKSFESHPIKGGGALTRSSQQVVKGQVLFSFLKCLLRQKLKIFI